MYVGYSNWTRSAYFMAAPLGFEPRTRGLLTTTVFTANLIVCGLDYPITYSFICLGANRLVSTPSSFEAWLGIDIS